MLAVGEYDESSVGGSIEIGDYNQRNKEIFFNLHEMAPFLIISSFHTSKRVLEGTGQLQHG